MNFRIFPFMEKWEEQFAVPRSVQQTIPVKRIYKDGIFFVGGRFSKTYRLLDINYAVASPDEQEAILKAYGDVLNSLDQEAETKITVYNRNLNEQNFENTMLMQEKSDELDLYRQEYNQMLLDKTTGSNNIIQEKYITISVEKKNIDEVRSFFQRVSTILSASLGKLSSGIRELNISERLRIFHDFFRNGEEQYFDFNLKQSMRLGEDFRDYICPDSIEFKGKYFKMGEQYGRVLFLKRYGSFIDDGVISALTELSRNLMFSLDIIPVTTEEGIKRLEKQILAVETDVARWQNKQNMNYNFSANVPYELEQMREEFKGVMNEMTNRDQRMMLTLVTLVHIADSFEQLDEDTETICSIARGCHCEFAILSQQQEDGLNTVLPYGVRKVQVLRTLLTEGTAGLMPFKTQEIQDSGGIFYGVNAISNNLILCNRKYLLNGNSFIFGVSGSGKSFITKEEIVSIVLGTDDDVIIVDPEREYGPLVEALGGEVVRISASGGNYINALDLSRAYGAGENPIVLKSEFVMSLCEQLIGNGKLGAKEKSIIDRCVSNVYRKYIRNYQGEPPTLKEFYAELLGQSEPEAREIALALELFTTGSLNIFAHQTNVDINNRIVVYDILDLGKQLKTVGMLVMLDAILNRVSANRQKGKRTHVYIDEVYLFFANEYSANFLSGAWKRFRKHGALATAITQNISECLDSPTARMMIANSEFLIMLNQAATDQMELAELLHIAENQRKYINNVEAGRGLIKVGGAIVPFINEFPKDTKLYKLMTTKPGE